MVGKMMTALATQAAVALLGNEDTVKQLVLVFRESWLY